MQGIEEQRRPRRRSRMKRIGAPLPGHPCLNNHGPKRDLVKGVANAELTRAVGRAPNFGQPALLSLYSSHCLLQPDVHSSAGDVEEHTSGLMLFSQILMKTAAIRVAPPRRAFLSSFHRFVSVFLLLSNSVTRFLLKAFEIIDFGCFSEHKRA
jgi:hypothetical protein